MSVPRVKSASPTGSRILVELLTANEALGSSLVLESNVQLNTPQGYVLAVGPMVPAEFGVQVGDRVFVSSNNVVFPPLSDKGERQQACIDYNGIYGVLHE